MDLFLSILITIYLALVVLSLIFVITCFIIEKVLIKKESKQSDNDVAEQGS